MLDTGKNVSYEYDSLNRLTKETNLAIGNEWRYTYDNGGNITKKEEYNPATGALRSSWDYGYGDSYWNLQAGAATEQATLPMTARATLQSTKGKR